MPPNARDSDSISQEAENADITQVTAVTNGASNSKGYSFNFVKIITVRNFSNY